MSMEDAKQSAVQSVERIVSKFTSGRLITTVIINAIGAVLLYKQLPIPGEFWGLWSGVNVFYFAQRQVEKPKEPKP